LAEQVREDDEAMVKEKEDEGEHEMNVRSTNIFAIF